MGDFLQFYFFSTLKIDYKSYKLEEKDFSSCQLIKLISFLVLHKTCNVTTIYEWLWEDREIENPNHALKNLIYRLRNILQQHLHIDDLIVVNAQSYQINPKYKIISDVSTFSDMYQHLNDNPKDYQTIIKLYKGKFLVHLNDVSIIQRRAIYFHSLYINIIKKYVHLVKDKKIIDDNEIKLIIQQALLIDKEEESLYELAMQVALLEGQYKEVYQLYQDANHCIYQKYNVLPSHTIKEYYHTCMNHLPLEETMLTLPTLELAYSTFLLFQQYGMLIDHLIYKIDFINQHSFPLSFYHNLNQLLKGMLKVKEYYVRVSPTRYVVIVNRKKDNAFPFLLERKLHYLLQHNHTEMKITLHPQRQLL